VITFSDEQIDGLSKALPGYIENALIKIQSILNDFQNNPGPVPDFSKNMSVSSSRPNEEWMKKKQSRIYGRGSSEYLQGIRSF